MPYHRWSTTPGVSASTAATPQAYGDCRGVACLSSLGVAFATSLRHSRLHAHRLDDGTLLASAPAAQAPSFVAVAPPHAAELDGKALVFVSAHPSPLVFEWDSGLGALRPLHDSPAGAALMRAAGSTGRDRPLAVMPPPAWPGHSGATRCHCLVVGSLRTASLRVLALPSLTLVHEHTLADGVEVMGLAADPHGRALVVCDGASGSVLVLPWPLPGHQLRVTAEDAIGAPRLAVSMP